MKSHNWISKSLAIACLTFAGVQVHAFVNTTAIEAVGESTNELIDRIDLIATGIDEESITKEDAITQIDAIIDEIDGLLDAEPANEGELLDLRDALVDMRLQLVGNDVSEEQTVGACATCNGGAVSAPAIGSGPVMGGGGFVSSGGGFAGGGGAVVGSGGLGGFLTSPLGLGAIAGTIIAVSIDDDDDDEASL